MINEELFDDPKDVQIAKLKLAIEAFKEYDEKRKKYYKDLAIRAGEMEAYIEELSETNDLHKKLLAQRREIRKLNEKIAQLTNDRSL
jgi:hypothetical protein